MKHLDLFKKMIIAYYSKSYRCFACSDKFPFFLERARSGSDDRPPTPTIAPVKSLLALPILAAGAPALRSAFCSGHGHSRQHAAMARSCGP